VLMPECYSCWVAVMMVSKVNVVIPRVLGSTFRVKVVLCSWFGFSVWFW